MNTRSHSERTVTSCQWFSGAAGFVAALVVPVVVIVLVAPRLSAHASAQMPADQSSESAVDRQAFEVASIKPNRSADGRRFIQFTGGRFTATGTTTKFLIEYAYEIKDEQISGGPRWIDAERYDVDAKLEDSIARELQALTPDQRRKANRLAIQSLLADRFQLRVGHQTKQLPVFALVVAKSGPKLASTTLKLDEIAAAGNPGPPKGPIIKLGFGQIVASAAPMSLFVDVLAQQPEIGGARDLR
jgi:uncharacterized protein (TIGR03435 family)